MSGVERVGLPPARVGEGATWCARSGRLLWVDVWAQEAHRYDPASGHDECWPLPERVGCIAPADDGRLVLGLKTGFWLLDPATGAAASWRAIGHPGDNRCNDSAVDQSGRLWCGTMHMHGAQGPRTGELLSWEAREGLRPRLAGLGVPNGLACSPDGRTLYLADSHPAVNTVWKMRLDPDSGALGPREVFLAPGALPGRPDGATVDVDGCYWIAAADGWAVLRVTPGGAVDRRIALPVAKPSKLAFGGPRLDTLYITSISATLKPEDIAEQPLAGCMFAVHVGPLGVPGHEVRLAEI
jgi:sugar lactone lactonase YvrE